MGSPFASHTTSDPIPLPFDPPHWVIVHKLTAREIEQAQTAHALGVSSGRASQWAAKFRRVLEGSISDKAEIQQAIRDPLTGYDRYALVRTGLGSWSYPQSVKPVTVKHEGKPDQIVDAVDDLVDEAVDFIATEVLRLTKPALFLTTEEEVDAAQKELSAAASMA